MTARDVIDTLFRVVLANDADQLGSIYAPDVVIDIPFAPPGMPTRYVGRDGLVRRWTAAQRERRFTAIDEVAVHETPDPDEIIVEYRVHGLVTTTGKEFALRFLMVVTVRDGLIVASRDYGDHIAAAKAYDRLPALLESLGRQ
jgi:ketosteroid isomerase-like protein